MNYTVDQMMGAGATPAPNTGIPQQQVQPQAGTPARTQSFGTN